MTIIEPPGQVENQLPPVEEQQGPNLIGTQIQVGSDAYQKMLTMFNKYFERSKSARRQFERQWYTNLAFFFGRQYVQWNSNKAGPIDRLYEPPAPPWRVRLISNKIRPIIRKELSKVIQEKPTGFVIPSSSDEEDIQAARAGDMVFEYLWRVQNGNAIVRQEQFWNLICGTAFFKDEYVPDKISQDGYTGDLNLEALTPFHIFVPDLTEEDIEKQTCIIHAMAKDKDWVKNNPSFYGTDKLDTKGPEGIVDQKFLNALGVQSKDSNQDKIYLKQIWIKPGMMAQYPDGLVAIWTENTILYAQDQWPFLHKEYPFTKTIHIPSGRFYGTSVIEDLIPIQKEYNRSRSQIVEAKNKMAKPQLIAPKGAVDTRKITSEPGLVIEYTPGFTPPQPLPLTPLPNYVMDHIQELKVEMEDISYQHEVSKGGSPSGVTSATAISFLQEQDDSPLAPTITSLEEAVQKLGRHMLEHVQQNWDAERQIRIVGMNGQFESFVFTKSALKGNTDFVVQSGSATPRSRAAKQAFIMEIGKLGWIPPDAALRFLDMSETGRLYEELQVDVRQAQRENLKMSLPVTDPELFMQTITNPVLETDEVTGEQNSEAYPVLPVDVNPYDNDVVHLATHQTYQKTQSYEVLDKQTKAFFQMHTEKHKIRIAEKLGIFGLPPYDPRLDAIAAGNAHVIGQLLMAPGQVDTDQQQGLEQQTPANGNQQGPIDGPNEQRQM